MHPGVERQLRVPLAPFVVSEIFQEVVGPDRRINLLSYGLLEAFPSASEEAARFLSFLTTQARGVSAVDGIACGERIEIRAVFVPERIRGKPHPEYGVIPALAYVYLVRE